ncbi:electron transfer flavoprotein beta subunit/FixA family protein [Chlorobium phaeovibrioides]|uniref:Electron transfer flavoprotein beta subunit/FixA family protein n=1 Tax=Chlorobium phaeovibrioides TaxID=1094 RepID=A0ABW9UMQ9_CHLPH|nr:electron transfer flavoprotein subunit beta/FixA family protein [Chlorobium phaeovibrioides]MWV54358.1 electron transfer flavoprotein beta subunit/FixA family protein [Chlorobium phaeovibrioides]RTY35751.1 electron transfer flavoprotein beta subunit/FixA family protein [Chlorobium phaeovibrioides]
MMHIAVCVCLVPDTASVFGFSDGTLDRSRITEVINPYDEYALEAALQLKERFGGGEVTVFSHAPRSGSEALRKTLAMGADRVVIAEGEGSDSWQTASILAHTLTSWYSAALPEVILCGRQSTDFGSAEVPGMLAERLGLPSVCAVSSLEGGEDGVFRLEREIEGGAEVLEVSVPVVISAEKGLNVPRKTSMRGVMEGRKKPVEIVEGSPVECARVGLGALLPVSNKKNCHFASDARALAGMLHERGLLQ